MVERYYQGEDWRLGRPLGRVSFTPETLHDLRSVTKSVVGLLYGIALAEGKVPPPDRALIDQFPHHADLAGDPLRRRLTIDHALSMRMGMEWNESVPYTTLANSERAMEAAPDRIRYVLERPLVAEPGERWIYNGGATSLLGRLIADGAGESLAEYAERVLFAPLGFGPTEWIRGGDGEPLAASGLRLSPRDLARIGQLVLQRGRWDGRQIVPEPWLDLSFEPVSSLADGLRYGRHWYRSAFPLGSESPPRREDWVGGFGNGGQSLYVVPRLDLAAALLFGNYDRPEQWAPGIALMREIVLPRILA
jgi:CubicO group peptidase (beta-lactamase class C family)